MRNKILILLSFVAFLSLHACMRRQYDHYSDIPFNKRFYRLPQSSLKSDVIYNQTYWKMDTLGKNGFRKFFCYAVLDQYDITGQLWKDWKLVFGRPNYRTHSTPKPTYEYYYYNLTCPPDLIIRDWVKDYYELGTNDVLRFSINNYSGRIDEVRHIRVDE